MSKENKGKKRSVLNGEGKETMDDTENQSNQGLF